MQGLREILPAKYEFLDVHENDTQYKIRTNGSLS